MDTDVNESPGEGVGTHHCQKGASNVTSIKMDPDRSIDKCQQIKLWQQSHYMSDSGIHTALGTNTPSVSSKLALDEIDTDDQMSGIKIQPYNQWPSFPMSSNPPESSILSPGTPSTGSVLGVDTLGDTPGGSHSASFSDMRDKLPDIDTDEAASAIPELVKLIKDEDDQVIIYQSSMMVFQLSKSEAIDALIKSMDMIECIISALGRTKDPETVRFLSGTLYNMSQTQTGLKLGGIPGLIRAVGQVGAKEDILEPCMCALRHLTSRHEEEETARHMVVHELNGLPVLARILHAASAGICPDLGLICQPPQNPVVSWMLVKAMVGLLRNLSVNIDSHFGMREYGLVTGLFLLLYATQHEITKRSASINSTPAFATMVQSVRLEEIVEGICGALHMLAKDCATRSYLALLKAPNLDIGPRVQPGSSGLTIFLHLLHSPHESIQRATAGVLAEISLDRDGLESLVNIPGASVRFDELTHSRNEAISTYASAVVIRMNEDRKGITGNPCLFPPHVEVLNTPPLPMDTMNTYSGHLIQSPSHGPASVGSSTLGHTGSHSQWSTSDHTAAMAVSPLSNSLTEMLGPPPGVYKGPSHCANYNTYWTDSMPSVPDSGGLYGDLGATYPSANYVQQHHTPHPHRTDHVPPTIGTAYTAPVIPTYTTLSAHRTEAGSGIGMPGQHVPLGITEMPTGHPTETTPTHRRSSYASLDTSGYMSPSSEMYMQPSPGGSYKMPPLTASTRHPRSMVSSSVYHGQSAMNGSTHHHHQHLASPPGLMHASQSVAGPGGYLSPELMSLDDGSADWLANS